MLSFYKRRMSDIKHMVFLRVVLESPGMLLFTVSDETHWRWASYTIMGPSLHVISNIHVLEEYKTGYNSIKISVNKLTATYIDK